ncbi:MAG: hypothetical protein U5R31_03975 [Acidimicrobiia bacterium]|nr:hypothetical protein [Acidimicrobiia bacterium]
MKSLFADRDFRERHRLVGGQLHQLGPGHGPDRVLRHRRRAPSAGRPGLVLRAHRELRQRLRRRCRTVLGVPIRRLQVASNRNDILTRFFATGELETREVVPTMSPSMDIQVSSNLERLLFEIHGRRGDEIAALPGAFPRTRAGCASTPTGSPSLGEVLGAIDESETLETIARTAERTGVVLDPHTAVGVRAARELGVDPGVPMVCLATAHPAKFPDAVREATGSVPPVPPRLAALDQLPERVREVPADLDVLREIIDGAVG